MAYGFSRNIAFYFKHHFIHSTTSPPPTSADQTEKTRYLHKKLNTIRKHIKVVYPFISKEQCLVGVTTNNKVKT